MTNLQKSLGVLPPAEPALVGINLTTAGHLADALARSARELEAYAREARAAAVGAGHLSLPPARLAAVARWADAEAIALRGVIRRLRAADATPVDRWSGGDHRAFAHPGRGHRLAERILAALEEGRLGAARTLLDEHGRDPVVATVLVGRLGADGIVALLRPAVAQWALPGEEAEAQRAVVLAVAGALARAGRHGTSVVGMPELAGAVERASVPLAALGLLFVGGARFPTRFLREAMTAVVTPINARLRAEPGLGPDPFLVPAAGAPVDARVAVLRAIARDRRAAVEAVGAADLDDLLHGSLGYLDGGVALSRVLVAATTPTDALGSPLTGPLDTTTSVVPGRAGENARRVIEWIGEHRHVPLGVQVELGRLARPWIGSFRSAGLDDVVRRHVHLDEERARAFLTYAQARSAAEDAIQDAAWTWAAAELDHLSGAGAGAAGFDAVGSVLGTVTVTGLDAAAARAVDADERATRQAQLWHRATGLVLARLPSPVRRVAGTFASRALARALPRADAEIRHWRDLRDLAVVHEYLALDHLTASIIWARREDNGLLTPPPPQLLVDPDHPDRGLRNPLTLGAAGAVAWTRWRSAQAARGPAPLQAAGDRFLLDTRR